MNTYNIILFQCKIKKTTEIVSTLKVTITTAVDVILDFFKEKIRLDISCELWLTA